MIFLVQKTGDAHQMLRIRGPTAAGTDLIIKGDGIAVVMFFKMVVFAANLRAVRKGAELKIVGRDDGHHPRTGKLFDRCFSTDDAVRRIRALKDLVDENEHRFFLLRPGDHLLDAQDLAVEGRTRIDVKIRIGLMRKFFAITVPPAYASTAFSASVRMKVDLPLILLPVMMTVSPPWL